MGFPPPPPDGPPPPSGQGGGFGPPQGFGPPPPPPPSGNDGYGYPQQGGGEGYGYPQQQGGGYGPPGPPGPPMPPGGYGYPQPGPGGYPPPPPNNNKRNAWIAVGVVAVIGAVVAGVVLAGGGDDKKKDDAKASGSPSITLPSGLPSGLPTDIPTPTFSLPSDDPSLDLPTDFPSFTLDPTPTEKVVPYVVLSPGKCFDAPTLSPSVDTVTTKSCSSAHDGQVVANETLSGSFSTDTEIQNKALELCTADARKHLPADGRMYYPYALFPKLTTYEIQGRKTVTCSLTLNNGSSATKGKKLYHPLG